MLLAVLFLWRGASAAQNGHWGTWYDPNNYALRTFRQEMETTIPADISSAPEFDRDMFIALLTRGFKDLDRNAMADFQKTLQAEKQRNASAGTLLTVTLRRLGPGYEKLGQFLGNRPDLVRQPLRSELAELSDRGSPISHYAVLQSVNDLLEQSEIIKRRMEETRAKTRFAAVFQTIDTASLGTGSIAQVHRGVLIDGTWVGVKVVKPGAEAGLKRNFDAILEVLDAGEHHVFGDLIREVRRQSLLETDLRNEAAALERAGRALAGRGVFVPRLWQELSGKDVLVMEFAPGTSPHRTQLSPEEKQRLAKEVFETVLYLVVKGDLHGDPHRGNVLVEAGRTSSDLFSLIDWGLTAQISLRERWHLGRLLLGMKSKSPKMVRRALQHIGARALQAADLEALLAEHVTGDAPFLSRTENLILALQRRRVQIPGPVVAAAKALLLAEGVSKELDPGFEPAKSMHWARLLPRGLGRLAPKALELGRMFGDVDAKARAERTRAAEDRLAAASKKLHQFVTTADPTRGRSERQHLYDALRRVRLFRDELEVHLATVAARARELESLHRTSLRQGQLLARQRRWLEAVLAEHQLRSRVVDEIGAYFGYRPDPEPWMRSPKPKPEVLELRQRVGALPRSVPRSRPPPTEVFAAVDALLEKDLQAVEWLAGLGLEVYREDAEREPVLKPPPSPSSTGEPARWVTIDLRIRTQYEARRFKVEEILAPLGTRPRQLEEARRALALAADDERRYLAVVEKTAHRYGWDRELQHRLTELRQQGLGRVSGLFVMPWRRARPVDAIIRQVRSLQRSGALRY